MSGSSPKALDVAKRTAQLQGVVLEAGPLEDLHWLAPDGLRLEHRPTTRIVKTGRGRLAAEGDGGTEGYLRWQPSSPTSGRMVRGAPRDLLVRFASLAEESDEAIRDFAASWGPLRLCGHHLPGSHVPSEWYEVVPGLPGCRLLDLLHPVEAVEDWRRYADQAASIIEITAALSQGRPSAKRLWKPMRSLQRDEPFESDTLWPEDLESFDLDPEDSEVLAEMLRSQRDRLDQWINWWLANSGAAPRIDARRGGLVMFATGGLFAALAYKLAKLFEEDAHTIRCSICGEFEIRKRKPQAGRKTYCKDPDCRERGRHRTSYRKVRDHAASEPYEEASHP